MSTKSKTSLTKFLETGMKSTQKCTGFRYPKWNSHDSIKLQKENQQDREREPTLMAPSRPR